MRKQILSKDAAIDKLIELVDVKNWDHETMVLYIEEHLCELYEKMSDKKLTSHLASEWEYKHKLRDEDECPYIVDSSTTAKVLHGA